MSKKAISLAAALAVASTSLAVPAAYAQSYPVADKVAQKVIEKYQTSSCEQIAVMKAAPPSPMAQRAIQLLRQDPAMRAYFIDKVASAVANKLFECGMIP